jgi:hypothetical protein
VIRPAPNSVDHEDGLHPPEDYSLVSALKDIGERMERMGDRMEVRLTSGFAQLNATIRMGGAVVLILLTVAFALALAANIRIETPIGSIEARPASDQGLKLESKTQP